MLEYEMYAPREKQSLTDSNTNMISRGSVSLIIYPTQTDDRQVASFTPAVSSSADDERVVTKYDRVRHEFSNDLRQQQVEHRCNSVRSIRPSY